MRKLYLFLIIATLLVGTGFALNVFSRNIEVDRTAKTSYTEMGISQVILSPMDSFGNVKVYQGKIELFQVNVPLQYCSEYKDNVCITWTDYTTSELEDMLVVEIQKGLEKLRLGYEEKKAETAKQTLIDGGTINIVSK